MALLYYSYVWTELQVPSLIVKWLLNFYICQLFFFVRTVNVHLIYGFRTLTMLFINCYCKAGDTHIVVLLILSITNWTFENSFILLSLWPCLMQTIAFFLLDTVKKTTYIFSLIYVCMRFLLDVDSYYVRLKNLYSWLILFYVGLIFYLRKL